MEKPDILGKFFDAYKLATGKDLEDKEIKFHPCDGHIIGNQHLGQPYVYLFYHKTKKQFLKIGKAGPNSQNRIYQHYNPGSSGSNLAASLLGSIEFNAEINGISEVGPWIQSNTLLYLLIIMNKKDRFLLNFLEAFLHLKLNPLFEKG